MSIKMVKHVRVGVAAIVRKSGKVLLAKRLGEHGLNTWGFPGGKLEFGESFELCVVREVKEETGISVRNIRFAAITNDVFDSEKHYVTIFMLCDWKKGSPEIMEPGKTEQWEWFDWDNLPRPLFLPIKNLLMQDFNPFKIQS